MQWRQLVVAAGVAGDQVQVGHGHVELGALGVFQGQELGHLIVDFQRRQPLIAADTVVDMHHRCAFAQLGKVFDHCIVVGVGAFLATSTLHHPLPEQRAFGDQCQRRIVQQQALIEGCNGDGQSMFTGHEIRPVFDGFRAKFHTLQQFEQYFAATGGFGSKQHAAIKLL